MENKAILTLEEVVGVLGKWLEKPIKVSWNVDGKKKEIAGGPIPTRPSRSTTPESNRGGYWVSCPGNFPLTWMIAGLFQEQESFEAFATRIDGDTFIIQGYTKRPLIIATNLWPLRNIKQKDQLHTPPGSPKVIFTIPKKLRLELYDSDDQGTPP